MGKLAARIQSYSLSIAAAADIDDVFPCRIFSSPVSNASRRRAEAVREAFEFHATCYAHSLTFATSRLLMADTLRRAAVAPMAKIKRAHVLK